MTNNDWVMVLVSAGAAVLILLLGMMAGWRCRSGQPPVALPSWPKKPKPVENPNPPKPQVKV